MATAPNQWAGILTGPVDGPTRVRAGARSYADLEPPLVGAVERLLDFVAEGPAE